MVSAEDILHDMDALSIMSSDNQALGRVGEVIIRIGQTARKMKAKRRNTSTVMERDSRLYHSQRGWLETPKAAGAA